MARKYVVSRRCFATMFGSGILKDRTAQYLIEPFILVEGGNLRD